MQWYVYMLCCSDGSLYTGITNDLDKRLAAHNQGKGARYTSGRLPVFYVWSETVDNKSAALKRERALKLLTRDQKLILIATQTKE